MLTNNENGPLEMGVWMSERNTKSATLPNMYTSYDLEQAIRIYEAMIEGLVMSKLEPGKSFDSPVEISYDGEIFGTGLNTIVAMAMEYNRPDLLGEAYKKLTKGDTNLKDIFYKLAKIAKDYNDGDSGANKVAEFKNEHRARMHDVAGLVAHEVAHRFHVPYPRNRLSLDEFREALGAYYSKDAMRELITKVWEQTYPTYMITEGDIKEIREWLVNDDDLRDVIVTAANHIKVRRVE